MAEFFLRLKNILLYISPFLYISIYNWHLDYFHIFAAVNNAAVNLGVKNLFEILISILLDKYPEVRLQNHMFIFSVSWGNFLFYTEAVIFHFHTKSVKIIMNKCTYSCPWPIFKNRKFLTCYWAKADLGGMNSLSFYWSEKDFISHSLLKDNFARYI